MWCLRWKFEGAFEWVGNGWRRGTGDILLGDLVVVSNVLIIGGREDTGGWKRR